MVRLLLSAAIATADAIHFMKQTGLHPPMSGDVPPPMSGDVPDVPPPSGDVPPPAADDHVDMPAPKDEIHEPVPPPTDATADKAPPKDEVHEPVPPPTDATTDNAPPMDDIHEPVPPPTDATAVQVPPTDEIHEAPVANLWNMRNPDEEAHMKEQYDTHVKGQGVEAFNKMCNDVCPNEDGDPSAEDCKDDICPTLWECSKEDDKAAGFDKVMQCLGQLPSPHQDAAPEIKTGEDKGHEHMPEGEDKAEDHA